MEYIIGEISDFFESFLGAALGFSGFWFQARIVTKWAEARTKKE
jgi:hypothetical protein